MPDAPNSSGLSFDLALWCDLSLSTGYSINERESALALLDQFPDRVRVICPEPAHAETFRDDRIEYVYDHRRHHPYHHLRHAIALRRKLRELAKRHATSAVIFRPSAFPIVPAFTVFDNTPVILKTLKVPWRPAARRRQRTRRLVRAGALPVYRYIIKHCLGADVESHSYARWLHFHFPIPASKIAVIPNGANADVFGPLNRLTCRRKYGWERFQFIVGYVGAIDAVRHAEVAFKAMRMLRNVPGLVFVLVGNGPLAAPLRRQIAREGLEKRMILPGPVPYEDVPSVIGAFDVAIDLSLVPFQVGDQTLHGSFSQKIAQYLACGVPVVAWETPDTKFLDQERVGRTVPIGDTGQLARVLRELSIHPSEHLVDRGRIREFALSELSTAGIARRRMRFWTELVGRGVGADR